MLGIAQDLRHSVRQLLARPAFTLTAVVTIGLAIGANTTIFSVLNGLILRPLPFDDSNRLALIWRASSNEGDGMLLTPDGELIRAWQEAGSSFDAIEAFTTGQGTLQLAGEPRLVQTASISHGYFAMIRLRPALGRDLIAADEETDAPPAVWLGHRFWRVHMGGDPAVVGRTIVLDGTAFSIAGVTHRDAMLAYASEQDPDLWLPLRRSGSGDYDGVGIFAFARLRSDASIERAELELSAATERVSREESSLRAARLMTPADMLGEATRRSLSVLMGAVALVLLIACANVANLLLVRATSRETELAVRGALGAGRARLVQQLLVESMLLATIGGVLGMALAVWGLDAIIALRPESLRELDRVHIDGRVLAFAATITVLTGILFGVMPALRATRTALSGTLRSGAVGVLGGARSKRLNAGLIVAEVALSLMLLVAAGLLVRTMMMLQNQPLGFQPQGLAIASVTVDADRYPEVSDARRLFFERLRDGAAALPGVRNASLVFATPPRFAMSFGQLDIDGVDLTGRELPTMFSMTFAGPDDFDMLDIELRAGRAFTAEDVAAGDRVIIGEALARAFFASPQDAIGQRMRTGDDGDWNEIVGVAAELPARGLTGRGGFMQLHYTTQTRYPPENLLLETDMAPLALRAALEDLVRRIDPGVPIDEVRPLPELLSATLARPRFNLVLLTLMAAIAMLLATVGLYGVVAYAVGARTREIGIRRALGAPAGGVVRLILAEGLRPALLGIVIGVVASLALTRTMTGMLYGLAPRDPLTLLVVPLALTAVAVLACLIPARRATRVEPAIALRAEP